MFIIKIRVDEQDAYSGCNPKLYSNAIWATKSSFWRLIKQIGNYAMNTRKLIKYKLFETRVDNMYQVFE